MNTTSSKVAESLYLVIQPVGKNNPTAKPAEVPLNHIAVIDCSGSMAWDLPKIQDQLKKKLPKMLREKDTISIVWFSGRGQYGVLLEAEPVATLADLTVVNQAIDRWLRPVGLTGFKEPIEEVSKLVDRISKKSNNAFSLFFMSDGCDNQWNRADILKAVEGAAGKLSSATFVEYGYYADRQLLSAMAEKAGGTLIFSEDFDKFAPALESAITKKVSGAPRIDVKIPGDPIGGFAFALQDGDLLTFEAFSGSASVPGDLKELYYLSPKSIGTEEKELLNISKAASGGQQNAFISAGFAAVSLFATRMKSDVVFPLLKGLGDVQFIEKFSGCFGKQKYSDFMEAAKSAAFGKGQFEKGWDPNRVPRDDAYTVLDLLRDLSEDDENRVLLDRPDFKYSRIGRGRVDANETLTVDELNEIQQLTSQIAATKEVAKIKDLHSKIAAITAGKSPGLKFVADDAKDQGYPISSLTLNEDRPNVSILVRKQGSVDISGKLPDEFKGKLPEKFTTFIFRNYTIIKDGLVNVDVLPVKVSEATYKKLKAELPQEVIGSEANTGSGFEMSLRLKVLPVINRKMVKATSAKFLFEKEYELAKARAFQKVYNTYKKEKFPRKSEGFSVLYGEPAANWLKEQGFTDYSGFSPKMVQADSTDYYLGKELVVSLAKLSSLPTLAKAKEAIEKGKVTPSVGLMVPAIKEVEDFLGSDIYKKAKNQDELFETWLDGQTKTATGDVRKLLFELAQVKFSIIVGQVWFTDLKTLDDNEMTISIDNQKIDCRVEQKEVQIKI